MINNVKTMDFINNIIRIIKNIINIACNVIVVIINSIILHISHDILELVLSLNVFDYICRLLQFDLDILFSITTIKMIIWINIMFKILKILND